MSLPLLSQKLEYTRVQSPSSINTFRQCPRKYFYQYIEKLPSRPSIHLIRGQIVHSALEEFFTINPNALSTDFFEFELQMILIELFTKHWTKNKDQLRCLGLSDDQLSFYRIETITMLKSWHTQFVKKLQLGMKELPLPAAYQKLTPQTEQHFKSEELGIQGYIDAIHQDEDGTRLMDYKTSSKKDFSEDYRLQLGIYALLYKLKHGTLPKSVGIDFLRHGEKHIDVTSDLLDFAFNEIVYVHSCTKSVDMKEYSRKPSGLCKWSSGQCDFYETCKPYG